MFKLGIVGAENSHSYRVGELCNIQKAVPMRVTMIWGETRKFAKTAAEIGAIPTIVKDWRELFGQVDGVMIDHRHPASHYEAAKFFIERKVPCFVDKPLCYRLRQAKALLDLARERRVPITTFSAIPVQDVFQKFKKQVMKSGAIRAVNVTGPVDLKSKYGGVFFYGIHQVDSIVEILGTDVKSAYVEKNGVNGVATMMYRNGAVATMNCIREGGGGFHWRVCTDKGVVTKDDTRDANPYTRTVKIVHKLLKSRKNPFPRERMLAPIAVLEAMEKSLKLGKRVNVAKL